MGGIKLTIYLKNCIFVILSLLNKTFECRVERLNPKSKLTYAPFPHPKDKCLARVFKVE